HRQEGKGRWPHSRSGHSGRSDEAGTVDGARGIEGRCRDPEEDRRGARTSQIVAQDAFVIAECVSRLHRRTHFSTTQGKRVDLFGEGDLLEKLAEKYKVSVQALTFRLSYLNNAAVRPYRALHRRIGDSV